MIKIRATFREVLALSKLPIAIIQIKFRISILFCIVKANSPRESSQLLGIRIVRIMKWKLSSELHLNTSFRALQTRRPLISDKAISSQIKVLSQSKPKNSSSKMQMVKESKHKNNGNNSNTS